MSERVRKYLLAGRSADGRSFVEEHKRPEHQIGDAQYFPSGLTSEWQLRPLTTHDMLEGVSYTPGIWLLARRLPEIGALYANIRLPFSLRRNTAGCVREAYRRLIAQRPELDSFYAEMEALSAKICAEVAPRQSDNTTKDPVMTSPEATP